MHSSCCSFGDAAEAQFSAKKVAAELAEYRKHGPGATTRMLRDGLTSTRQTTGRLIDVGAGFGALTHELLDRGMTAPVLVEASSAYLRAATEEATRRGRAHAIDYVHGDFVAVADRLPSATVVTLDRVVCCYPSYASLLEAAVRHAERGVALSYPRDRWFVRLGLAFENGLRRWRGNPFRAYVHSPSAMARTLNRAGFVLACRRRTLKWYADVFVRSLPADVLEREHVLPVNESA